MTKINIELEFDENNLGEMWMNPDNLDILLYSKEFTRRALLKVNKFKVLK